MFELKNYFSTSASILIFFMISTVAFGQQSRYVKSKAMIAPTFFTNPLVYKNDGGCNFENLDSARFDGQISTNQKILFCKTLQKISLKLDGNWSPALKSEMQQIWQIFARENVKICLFKFGVPSGYRAMAEIADEKTGGNGFNINLYLRPEQTGDKSFFPIFMHELRHIFDLYTIWKNKTSITQAELEKRAFRITGKINQELPDNDRYSGLPTFWKNSWKNLSPNEINQKREAKIEKFMQNNSVYKNLLINPEKHLIDYSSNQSITETSKLNGSKSERLPERLNIRQTKKLLPQEINEVSFQMEKAADATNPDQILRAALLNEQNLYHKMDNFVYDQNLQLQCWQKRKVTENYELERLVTRTQSGEALFQNKKGSPGLFSSPSCVLDFEIIKSDATDTFWAAPYLDQMRIKFDSFTTVDNIPVARYTVFQPSQKMFKQIESHYPHIKSFRVFVGTIFVSVEDSQIVKFWGTSFPETQTTGYSSRVGGSYGATAVRQKLASGIWVTTLLNIVAVTNEKNKMKPFNYVVKYRNYRQGTTDVVILDDEEAVTKQSL